MEKRFYSIKQAASYCGVSSTLLYQKIREKAIRHYRVGTKIVFDVADLDVFIMRNEVKSLEQLKKESQEK